MVALCIDKFRVKEQQRLDLAAFPTRLEGVYRNKADYVRQIQGWRRDLRDLQVLLYASQKTGLLAAFQGLDGSGKDSIARRVFAGVNPRGTHVTAFKRPTPEELKHPWLWRHEIALPARGMIGIWDRTHYEEVGAVRVHPGFLRARGIEPGEAGKRFWNDRLNVIRDWEAGQSREGVSFLKFFLHVSAREQARRLLDRIRRPDKHWKFSLNDLEERKHRAEYLKVYSEAISATSTSESPWYVIPADDKPAAALLISKIVNRHLKAMKLKFPRMSAAERKTLKAAAAELEREIAETAD